MPNPGSSPVLVPPPSARADARRNYERLVAAANEIFDEQGANASLEAIARRAGLGSATLHRHFPSRYALMEVVYWNQIGVLCESGRALLDAAALDAALTVWLRKFISVAAERGLATALMASRHDTAVRFFDACHDAIRAAGAPLLSQAQSSGAIRSDVELDDVLHLVNAIALTIEHDPDGSNRADRLLSLLIEGLRERGPDGVDDPIPFRDARHAG